MSNDGGPAFPGDVKLQTSGGYEVQRGMALRDYFAGQALAGVVERCSRDTRNEGERMEQMFARKSYSIADAMLAARKEASNDGS